MVGNNVPEGLSLKGKEKFARIANFSSKKNFFLKTKKKKRNSFHDTAPFFLKT
jgi:hypothetical protein